MRIGEIKKPAELLEPDSADPKYEFSNFIKVEKFGERNASKKKLKLLKVIDPAVRAATEEDEVVYYITGGMRISTLEQLFVGWIAAYYNLMGFVFTSRRILLVHLKSNKKRGTYIGSIDYADIQKISTSFFGSLTIKFINGKSIGFTKIPKVDRKYLKEFLNSVVNTDAAKNKAARDIRNMCPQCFVEIADFPEKCMGCATAFKKPKTAAWLSLLMPGLGDLYLGSKALGAIELICMLLIWSSIVLDITDPASAETELSETLAFALLFFIIAHPLDGLKSYYLAKKGLIPTQPVKYSGE